MANSMLSPFGDRCIRSIWSGRLFDSTPTTGRPERIVRGLTYASAGGDPQCTDSSRFWCIWGFWAGEGSLADRGPTGREAQMPYFRPFPVTDESDRTRVCARRRGYCPQMHQNHLETERVTFQPNQEW